MVEGEFVIWIGFKQAHRAQDILQTHLQITLAGFENGAFPMGMRDVIEDWLVRPGCIVLGLGVQEKRNKGTTAND